MHRTYEGAVSGEIPKTHSLYGATSARKGAARAAFGSGFQAWHRSFQVFLDGPDRDEEGGRDLLVREPVRRKLSHPLLCRRQLVGILAASAAEHGRARTSPLRPIRVSPSRRTPQRPAPASCVRRPTSGRAAAPCRGRASAGPVEAEAELAVGVGGLRRAASRRRTPCEVRAHRPFRACEPPGMLLRLREDRAAAR